jgi:hypothetical protein
VAVLGLVGRLPSDIARATEAVAWVRTWRHWRPEFEPLVAYEAALEALWADPDITRYDLAKKAIQAARRIAPYQQEKTI